MYMSSSIVALQVNISTYLFRHFGPQKDKFSLGVIALKLLPSGNLLLGTGEGKIAEISTPPKGNSFPAFDFESLQGMAISRCR